MTKDARLLLEQAQWLVVLGERLDMERLVLKKLVDNGVDYNDPRILETLGRITEVDSEWKQLEAEHLLLRKKFGLP